MVIFGPNKFTVNTVPNLVYRSLIVTQKPLLKSEGNRARTFTTGGSGLVDRWALLFHLEILVAITDMTKIAMANHVVPAANLSIML